MVKEIINKGYVRASGLTDPGTPEDIQRRLGSGTNTDTIATQFHNTVTRGVHSEMRLLGSSNKSAVESMSRSTNLAKGLIQTLANQDPVQKTDAYFNEAVKNSIQYEIQQAYLTNPDDPAGFLSAKQLIIEDLTNQGFGSNQSRDIVEQLGSKYDPIILKQWRTKECSRERAIAKQSLQNDLRDMQISVPALMSSDAVDRQHGLELFTKAYQSYHAYDQASDLNGKPIFDDNGLAYKKSILGETINQAYCTCHYDNLSTLQEKQAFIMDILDGKATGEIDINGQKLYIRTGDLPYKRRKSLAADLTNRFNQECVNLKVDNDKTYARGVISGELTAIPNSPECQEALDNYYCSLLGNQVSDIANAVGSDPSVQISDLATIHTNFINKSGYAPKSMLDVLGNNIANGDDGSFQVACLSANALDNAILGSDKHYKDIGYAMLASKQITNGVNPGEVKAGIKKLIEDEASEKPAKRIAALDSMMKSQPDIFGDATILKQVFPDFSGEMRPESRVEFADQYKQLVRTYYSYTNDIGIAERVAALQMRQSWCVSEINGYEDCVQYAPERYYANKMLDSNSMRNRVKIYLENNSQSNYSDGFAVLYDEDTLKQIESGSKDPDYAVFVVSNGELVPAYDKDNMQIRVGRNIWRTDTDHLLDGQYELINQNELLKEHAKLFEVQYNNHLKRYSIDVLMGGNGIPDLN